MSWAQNWEIASIAGPGILDRLGSFAGTSNFNQEKGGFIEANYRGLMRRFFCVENVGHIDWQSYINKIETKAADDPGNEIGRAHVVTPVTLEHRMPSSA